MKKPNIEQLILELTRKCNMNCKHCLRGKSENVEMPFEVIKKSLDSFDDIQSITFSGGEPTLCEDTIEQTVDYIIQNKISVHGFYMVSNRKKVSIRTMLALSKLYAYIYQQDNWMEDYQCVFDVSLDQYHETIDSENMGLLRAFSFVLQRGNINPEAIIAEGNANFNNIGVRAINHKKKFYVSSCSNEYGNIYELVYVNAKGNIFADCDFSYETQDKLPAISILQNTTFDELVKQYEKQVCI